MSSIGYDVRDRNLNVNQAEAATVRQIPALPEKQARSESWKKALDRDGIVSKIRVSRKGTRSGGQLLARRADELLSNPIYIANSS